MRVFYLIDIQLIKNHFVTATGFKPVTPTSVVWYSIQLSYAAIFFTLASAKIMSFFEISKQ